MQFFEIIEASLEQLKKAKLLDDFSLASDALYADALISYLQGDLEQLLIFKSDNIELQSLINLRVLILKQEIGEGVAPSAVTDAVSALANLGYSREQAANAVGAAMREAGEDAESAKLQDG